MIDADLPWLVGCASNGTIRRVGATHGRLASMLSLYTVRRSIRRGGRRGEGAMTRVGGMDCIVHCIVAFVIGIVHTSNNLGPREVGIKHDSWAMFPVPLCLLSSSVYAAFQKKTIAWLR